MMMQGIKLSTHLDQLICLRVYVVVTQYCVSLHSLISNQIADGGCARLSAALEQCRELQVLE